MNAAHPFTYDMLAEYRVSRAMPWFTKPWDLNLFIIRSGNVGKWDDWIVFAFIADDDLKVVRAFPCTGDAWGGEWTNPTNKDGCVYVLDQHVPGGYKIGAHKGRPALRQNANYDCVRWPPGMGFAPSIQALEDHAAAGAKFSGWPGCHLHNRATMRTPHAPDTDDSEGCTVPLFYFDHSSIMSIADCQLARHGWDEISPTFAKLSDVLPDNHPWEMT